MLPEPHEIRLSFSARSGLPGPCALSLRRGRCDRFHAVSRRSTFSLTLLSAALVLLSATPGALAADGIGLAGRVDDFEITLFCFAVILFFPVLVTVLSLIQNRLEARKEQRRYDLERLS